MAQFVTLLHRGQTKKIALCNGLPIKEINQNIKAAFNLISSVVGLEDAAQGIIYPLSLLSKDVNVFEASTVFSLLLSFDPSLPQDQDSDEEQEDAENDEEEEEANGGYFESKRQAPASAYDDGEEEQDQEQEDVRAQYPRMETKQRAYDPEADEEYDEDEDEDEAARTQHMLQFIQKNTAFSTLPMNEILEVFRSAAAEAGVIDRPTFQRCFATVVNKRASREETPDKELVKTIANRVFDVFDRDGNGTVDHAEFVAGLSLLCRASSDDKIKAAFSLFDLDGDGFISYPEMLRYMTSFFEVCFALDPKMRTRFPDTTAAQVGQATATHCFMRADVNKDGRISFDEFKTWCDSDDIAAATVPQ